jgi:hypothetical protein
MVAAISAQESHFETFAQLRDQFLIQGSYLRSYVCLTKTQLERRSASEGTVVSLCMEQDTYGSRNFLRPEFVACWQYLHDQVASTAAVLTSN